MSLANESKPDRNSHYVDLLRSAKRLLLPHGYCDFVYSSTVSKGSPDKPDGETRQKCAFPPGKTILNARRYRVAAPSIRFVPWAALASCWPLPQQLLPASAAGGGRRRCTLGIFSGKIIYNFAFVALCGAFQTHFHGRGVATANGSCSAAFCESAALRGTNPLRLTAFASSPEGGAFGKEMKSAWTAKGSPFEERLPPLRGKMSPQVTKGGICHRR